MANFSRNYKLEKNEKTALLLMLEDVKKIVTDFIAFLKESEKQEEIKLKPIDYME